MCGIWTVGAIYYCSNITLDQLNTTVQRRARAFFFARNREYSSKNIVQEQDSFFGKKVIRKSKQYFERKFKGGIHD